MMYSSMKQGARCSGRIRVYSNIREDAMPAAPFWRVGGHSEHTVLVAVAHACIWHLCSSRPAPLLTFAHDHLQQPGMIPCTPRRPPAPWLALPLTPPSQTAVRVRQLALTSDPANPNSSHARRERPSPTERLNSAASMQSDGIRRVAMVLRPLARAHAARATASARASDAPQSVPRVAFHPLPKPPP